MTFIPTYTCLRMQSFNSSRLRGLMELHSMRLTYSRGFRVGKYPGLGVLAFTIWDLLPRNLRS